MNNIGDRIRKRRKQLGMTLETLASNVGTSKQTIQRYETGIIQNIPSDKIEIIANILNVSPAYIMGWETYSNISNEVIEYSLDKLSGNELHDSACKVIEVVKEKYNNDLDVLSICQILNHYMYLIDNLMENKPANINERIIISSSFPKPVRDLYLLNAEGMELAGNFIEMLLKKGEYKK